MSFELPSDFASRFYNSAWFELLCFLLLCFLPFGGRCTCGAYSSISPRSIFRKSSFLAAPTPLQLPSLLCMTTREEARGSERRQRRRYRPAAQIASCSSTHNSTAPLINDSRLLVGIGFRCATILATTSKVTASPSLSHDPLLQLEPAPQKWLGPVAVAPFPAL